jgi:mRNA-degrading endonuclease RelE of RelBE toxin-antitoxin system
MIKFLFLQRFIKNVKKLQKKYPNIKDDLKHLSQELSENPQKGILLESNFYKIRLKNSNTKSGKSAGYRVVYYYINQKNEICYCTIFSKSDIDTLSDKDLTYLLQEYKQK